MGRSSRNTTVRSGARLYLRKEETAKRLDPFEREARAGLPDVDLARKAGVAVSSVRFWRRSRGIRQAVGAARRTEAVRARALDLMGNPLQDVLQRAHSSVLEGEWSAPEYVVRGGIDYDLMMEQCHLLSVHGYSIEQIARAHGYTQSTVEQALLLYARHKEEG